MSMIPNQAILAIGLDAADPGLIGRWCAQGELPNFGRLIAEGSYRELHSCTALSSGATWPTIATGLAPGKHGMGFYHRQLRNGTYRIVKKYADEVRPDYFWRHGSAAGKRVAIFDIPVTCPVPQFNGVQIVGWGIEGLNWKQCSEPSHLLSEVIQRFGRHPLDGWYQSQIDTIEGWIALRDKLRDGARLRTRVAKWLLEREPWDLFLVGYAEPHWAGHYFFHLMDETHPRHDPDAARACREAILDVYREIDEAIGEFRRARPDAAVLVFSNTGMGPNYSGMHLVPEILERLGMSGGRTKPESRSDSAPQRRWGAYAVRTVESVVSAKNIERVRRLVPEKLWDTWTRIFLNLGNNWRNSKAFAVPSDFTGAVRINLRGREPHGIVEPGAEYDRLCEELAREFLALVNPATGQKAVCEVIRFRECYRGPCVDEFPDLIVRWEGSRPIDSLSSPRIGTVRGVLPDKRSGAHRTYGFLIASGDAIGKSRRLAPADIVDIAPTVLHLQGLPVPKSMDGRVLAEMLEERV